MGQFDRKKKSEPKHGKPPSSGASRAPIVAGSRQRPDWSGPTFLHKKKPRPRSDAPKSAPEPVVIENRLPVELQQLILDIFRSTFPASEDFDALKPTLREITEALSLKDLKRAFGSEEHLEAYAIRWSPSRALAYTNLLAWVLEKIRHGDGDDETGNALINHVANSESTKAGEKAPVKILCIGGGASELIALSSLLRILHPTTSLGRKTDVPSDIASGSSLEHLSISDEVSQSTLFDVTLLDGAGWSSVLSKLYTSLTTPPILSKYASAAARAANTSFLSVPALTHTFNQKDVFQLGVEDLRAISGSSPALVTLFLTLNDLYSSSIPKTTAFLRRVTQAVPKDCLLLVVDTPEACVEVITSRPSDDGQAEVYEKKSYAMSWLLDNTLVPPPPKTADGGVSEEEQPAVSWHKIVNENDVRYKLEEGLRYPVSLENLKFQVHLYRRA